MILGCLLIGLFLSQRPPAADRPPEPLTELRDAAIAIYTPALRGDWPTASERLKTLNEAVADMPTHVGKPDLVQQLRGRLLALRRAVHDHRSVVAATNANWVARLADEIGSAYDTTLPLDIRLLGFFGRALEIDGVRRGSRTRADLADLHTVWRRVEDSVLQHNGTDAVRQFSDALVALDGAVRGGGLASAARTELDAAQRVAALYQVPHTGM